MGRKHLKSPDTLSLVLQIIKEQLPDQVLDVEIAKKMIDYGIRDEVRDFVTEVMNNDPILMEMFRDDPPNTTANICLAVIHGLFRRHKIALIDPEKPK